MIDFNPLITVPAYEEAKVPFTLAQAFSINEAQRAFPVGYANKNWLSPQEYSLTNILSSMVTTQGLPLM